MHRTEKKSARQQEESSPTNKRVCMHSLSLCLSYVSTYLCVYIYIYTYIYIYINIYTYTYTHTFIYIYMYICIYIHIHMHTHTHIYIYIYIVCLFPISRHLIAMPLRCRCEGCAASMKYLAGGSDVGAKIRLGLRTEVLGRVFLQVRGQPPKTFPVYWMPSSHSCIKQQAFD